ncbi:hypothetical protein A3I25_00400 [Candidatus Nomurabacteria bacterium RIFCSPLOWO2_02_FULL_42_17]|uniref:Chromosomal replication initiator protein DnaA n=2 Tax=Candidatus Nomuraibacteriota TaxID=1752729 RepID=A0A1F6WIX2_9BACT|nr:MAG: Chromosomal replication initiator protein DnaA [Candidatus Daviesbacteria bacterium GW2011_GWF2_38_7]KKS45294.1 MAG: Chromosomal replication initiator protein DnaA [Parcubacteria group bacterium GW2011_GWA2_42_18]OGI81857.1 MAG: hypothetical protein A3B93_02005 [Candidatus Nomurabacteria bacterium RIFCSPHIGHO2_02_FULL_42_24]OGI96205.1 MAG: hypothetical protein A3I25_00400 [Candidatus Nomurabacteria bacterium RIFCSPLOWO2_02_FULL_42_17]
MLDHKQVWSNCLTEIESNISKANFSTWFKNTNILKEEGGVVFLCVPNEFVKEWIANKFHRLILKTLVETAEHIRAVEYVVTRAPEQNQTHNTQGKIMINRGELPFHDLYVSRDDNLNPRYTFDSFIVGSFNELAHAAARAVINNPGRAYNPLFIYGGTGLGKTHLIQATGNSIKSRYPDKKVYYITLERFATDLVNSFQNNKANSFKEKYRKYDVLIIDDIQFVGKMDKTQEELFHTFNTFYESGRPIIFSSDKHPNFIPGLEDRLKSRFAQGMTVDITEPDYESRLAVLKAKSSELNIDIPLDVLEYIARSVNGNIRELEGSLNTVICQIQLKNGLTINEVKKLVCNNIKPKKNVSVKDIVKIIADFYNVNEGVIYEKTRRREIVRTRQIIMYLLREDYSVSYPLIGQKLGGKDHTTVIHSYEKVKNELKTNPTIYEELERIRAILK